MADTINKSMAAEGSPVYRRLSQQEFNDIAGRILYEDNHLLIFNKRSGEIVQADKTEDECMSTTLKAFVPAPCPLPVRMPMAILSSRLLM